MFDSSKDQIIGNHPVKYLNIRLRMDQNLNNNRKKGYIKGSIYVARWIYA